MRFFFPLPDVKIYVNVLDYCSVFLSLECVSLFKHFCSRSNAVSDLIALNIFGYINFTFNYTVQCCLPNGVDTLWYFILLPLHYKAINGR